MNQQSIDENGIGFILNRVSLFIVWLFLAGSYFMWTAGLDNSLATFFYNNSGALLLIGTIFLFILNFGKINFRTQDLIVLIIAFSSFAFYSYFNDSRGSKVGEDLILLVIVFWLFFMNKIDFLPMDKTIFALTAALVIGITTFRIFNELPSILEGESIWVNDNRLSDIWINTNTIGLSLMTAGMILASFIQAIRQLWIRLPLQVMITGIVVIDIWLTQSRGALFAFCLFSLLTLLPKFILTNLKIIMTSLTVILLSAFPITYIFAASETLNLFTGREEIWKDFFDHLFSNPSHFLIGMAPYHFTRESADRIEVLGYHNSYNNILGYFGVIGLILFSAFLLTFIYTNLSRAEITRMQASFVWAFFCILAYGFMEDTLMSFAWVPIIYFLLGFLNESSKIRKTWLDDEFYQEEYPTESASYTRRSRRGRGHHYF